jgi:hypothetical protein
MATGDITATIPNLDGGAVDLLIEGFTTGATWDVGEGAGTALFDLDNADAILTLTGPGYNTDGTVNSSATYTSRLNAVRRKPYPDDASEDQDTSGSDLDIRFNADRWLWSGYTATLTASTALVTNAGGASQTSNALSGAAVTNSSTLAPPKVIAQWDLQTSVPAQRVTADFTVGIEAYYHFGIACVEFTATGATSSHEQTVRVTTKTARQSANTSLWGEAYEATIPIAGFTQGETITINAVVKPNVGPSASVLDTADTTGADNEILLRSNLSFTCNKTGALDQFAYVDTSTGNDGTGVVSGTAATAEASPYATIKGALDDGANIVRCTTGTHTIAAPAVSSADYWVFVEAAPSATVTVQTSANLLYKTKRLCIRNVTLNTAHFWDGENTDRWLWIDNCTVSQTSTTVGFGYRSKGVYITECSGSFADLLSFSSSRVAYAFDGCSFTDFANTDCSYRMTRCVGDVFFSQKATANPAPTQDGFIVSFNALEVADRDDNCIFLNSGSAIDISTGFAVVGNTIERHGTGTSTAPAVQIYADLNENDCTNIMLLGNTVVGQRINFAYNSVGTVSLVRSNLLFIGNAAEDGSNIKGDTFGTPNSNRVGNFPTQHGTGVFHNRSHQTTFPANDSSASGARGFLGPNTIDYAGLTALGFVDDQSLNSAGNAGGGDYTPDTGSVLIDQLPEAYQFTDYDLYGNRLPSTADIGGVQRGSVVDGTGQIQADGTIRMNFTRLSGLWGSTITPDNTKITAISQTTGGTRTFTVGSVSGAGSGTLQVIITPSPLIYSTASGGTVTVTIGEGWLADENGNTTAAFSGIDDVDNSSTQTPPSTTLFLTRGRGGGSVSSKSTVRVINR